MDFEQFMILFRGAVAAVENGEVVEIDLEAEALDMDEGGLEVSVTIRRNQWKVSGDG